MGMTSFKDVHSEAERAEKAAQGLSMGKIPVVCEKRADCALPDLTSKKFLVSFSMTVDTFTELLRKRISQEVSGQFYLFIKDEVLRAGKTSMHELYKAYKDTDELLYVLYSDDMPDDMAQMGPFKSAHSAQERMDEAQEALAQEKIPIICERAEGSSLADLAKKKYVVSPTMKVGFFSVLIKERIAAQVTEPFFLFIGNRVLTANEISMQQLYETNKDKDGLLYVTYDDHAPESAVRVGAYRVTHALAERKQETAEAAAMGKIPIICERREGAHVADLANKKFVVLPTMTVGTVAALLSKRVASEVDQRIHLFIGDSVLTASSVAISDLYNAYKDAEDGLLYVTYSSEVPPLTPQLGQYKASYTHKERVADAEKALWLEKVPIICERKEGSTIPAINQRKFFVSQEITIGKLIELLQERIAQELNSPIYIFVRGDTITNYDEPIMEVYDGYKDTDKFLYITYSDTRSAK